MPRQPLDPLSGSPPADATGKVEVGSKSYKLEPKSKPVATGETKTLELKPKKKSAKEKIAKALKNGKKATAELAVTLSDGADKPRRRT